MGMWAGSNAACPHAHRARLPRIVSVGFHTKRRGTLQSHKRRRFRVVTTDSKHAHPVAPNVLGRDFEATAPNQKWLADMTYVPTKEGWLYLALVLDLYARKLVGWAMSETMPQELTLSALDVALGWRDPDAGLVHHSDRGSQYAAKDYRSKLKARGITVSMSRKGDCWDNAPMESVNGTLKVECVNDAHFETREQARQAIIEYIGYYNTERRHSSLGNIAPAEFERLWRVGVEHKDLGAARSPEPAAADHLGRSEGSSQQARTRVPGLHRGCRADGVPAAVLAGLEPRRIPVGLAQASCAGQLLSGKPRRTQRHRPQQTQERTTPPLHHRRVLGSSRTLVMSPFTETSISRI